MLSKNPNVLICRSVGRVLVVDAIFTGDQNSRIMKIFAHITVIFLSIYILCENHITSKYRANFECRKNITEPWGTRPCSFHTGLPFKPECRLQIADLVIGKMTNRHEIGTNRSGISTNLPVAAR